MSHLASRFSSRVMKPADWKGIKHFAPHEFDHPGKMGFEFMRWLDALRAKVGMSLTPSSDWRSPAGNALAGGALQSAHMDAIVNAIDLSGQNMTGPKRLFVVMAALELGCRRIGIYANGSVHLDRTEDVRPESLWVKV